MKVIRTVSAFGVIIFAFGMMLPSRALAGSVVFSDLLADPVPLVTGVIGLVSSPSDDDASNVTADAVKSDLIPTIDTSLAAAALEHPFTAVIADAPVLTNSVDAGVGATAADAVPEPATLVLLGTGLLGLAATLRSRRR